MTGVSGVARRPLSEMNVVPLVDVMLVLLVIFMITTPLLTQGVKVHLPQTTAAALPMQKKPIIVTVDAAGNFYLNIADKPNQPITTRTLSFLLTNQLQAMTTNERPVLVRGDQQVSYGKVMEAMTVLRAVGIQNVGLVTETPKVTVYP